MSDVAARPDALDDGRRGSGDILRGVHLARQKRPVCGDGARENLLPGIDLRAAFDSHTYGSMWVSVRNDGKAVFEDTWILAGDLASVFDNIEASGAVVERRGSGGTI